MGVPLQVNTVLLCSMMTKDVFSNTTSDLLHGHILKTQTIM